MKTVYLVDVSSMYFRAFYAIRQLSNSKGMPTNALYGLISMTIKLLKDMKAEHVAYCYDRKEPSFRVEIDENYKANRTEMPEELAQQMPYIPQIVDALGIPSFSVPKYEADDVIGTLATYISGQGHKVVIISGDKDFGQLVKDGSVEIFDPMKDVRYNEAGVLDKMGVPPSLVVDYLAIVGDSSDNIPGVRGVGPKGAQTLLNKYGGLKEIYERIDEVQPEGTRKKLLESKDNAFMSKKLSQIVLDIPMKLDMNSFKLRPFLRDKLMDLLKELEFKQFEKTLLGEGAKVEITNEAPPAGMEVAPTRAAVVGPEIKASEEIEADAEMLAKVLTPESEVWGIHTTRGYAIGHDGKCYIIQDDTKKVGEVLSSKKLFWKGHDVKEFWKVFNLKKPNCVWDHMLAAYVVRAGAIGNFEETYQKYLSPLPELPSFSQLQKAHQELEFALAEKLKAQSGLKVYEVLELPLVSVLYEMEQKGVLIDSDVLRKQSGEIAKDVKKLEEEIFQVCGESFNLGSPKQLAQVLFERMKMPPGRKTKTGFSTDSDVLEKLSADYPVCLKLIEHRELMKLRSTYIDTLPILAEKDGGRVHSHFRQAVAVTGRLSSTDPNLQNIPIRTERGNAIRQAFIADRRHTLISADYSQIELRILAHITGDKGLIHAFENDLDVHAATASEVFGVKLEDVTPDLRRTAKAVNFGIAYGMGAFGLAQNLRIPNGEAAEIIKKYFMKFSGVREYMTSIVETAKKQGYVETLYGRRRYLDELTNKNANIRQFGERAAINAPMQGTASDIVKRAMIDAFGETHGVMIMQVHDELVFESPTDSAKEDAAKVVSVMENAIKLRVPLKVGIGVGSNWLKAHS